ncbi:SpoIIE family protein phosphatase [Embleya sp. NBC_00896]|uniref:ATP-binding SpoIIE family protein phosphatase n=1 Tax=Embleya sp. NBC_00896 TaxID=2975961 RepID=UPI00386EB773|nr:SpoIIE family protein phosphatase [Embleya sp. NBC_00896]
MFDLANFTVSDMVVCSSELRQVTADSPTMEDAARAIVQHLRATFRDPHTGRPQLVLTRLFQTMPWRNLTPDLEERALHRQPDLVPHPDLRCLTLLATTGDHPDWCDRTRSRHHQIAAFPSAEAVRRAPMISAMLDQLGVTPEQIVAGPLPTDNDWDRHDIHHIPDALTSGAVPDKDFIRDNGIKSVVGYAGNLPDGELFTVLMFTRVHVPARIAELFRTVAVSTRLALLPLNTAPLFAGGPTPHIPTTHVAAARLDALEQLLAAHEGTTAQQALAAEDARDRVRSQQEQLAHKQRRLDQETRIVETLYSVGQQLTRELNLERLVQTATDAATSVIAAEHGIFRYIDYDTGGVAGTRYAVTSPDPTLIDRLPRPRPVSAARTRPKTTCAPPSTVRRGDLTEDPAAAHLLPYAITADGHPPVRSLLTIPVTTATGEDLGAFSFCHTKADVFTERDEQLALGIASQAATAIENARLFRSVRDTAVELQRSLLPQVPPDLDELNIAFRYLPGAKGQQVGGDWFDVIPLSAGRIALVVGDVMGRGLQAAAVMGQLRTAVRAYAVMDLPPAQVMRHLNRLVTGLGGEDQIITCVYAVYDPGDATIHWSNAGHLPPALIGADGKVELLEDDLGVPLGLDGTTFEDAYVGFDTGDQLLLYTDGLVESHNASLTDRLQELTKHIDSTTGGAYNVADVADLLAKTMLTGQEPDDVALLLVRARHSVERTANLDLPPTPRSAREARDFVRATLGRWGLADHNDTLCSVVTELVANAAEHARTPMELRLRHHPGRLIVEVVDHDGRLPKEIASPGHDERHRGLCIVAGLTTDWGVRPTDTGKIVWAEVRDR